MKDPFIDLLLELAKSHKTTAKWVFVRSPEVGLTLGERLLLSGQNWANFRFTTPFQLALEISAPSLVRRGIRPKPEELGPSLIHSLALQLPAEIPLRFTPLLTQPGMDECLWRALRELRTAGIASELIADLELQAYLCLFEAYLQEQNLADRAQIFLEAREGKSPLREGDLRVEDPSALWSPLERDFLDRLPGHKLSVPRWPGKTPRRLQPAPEKIPHPLSDCDLLYWIAHPDEAPAAFNDGTLEFFVAGRREAEIQEVIRQIASREIRADQVEIACGDTASLPLLYEKLHSAGPPATLELGLPLPWSRVGAGALGFLDWLEQDCPTFLLRDLLLSGLFRPEGLGSIQAARLLEQAQTTLKRESYLNCLNRLELSQTRRSQDPDADTERRQNYLDQAAQAALLGNWFQELFARFPPPVQGQIQTGEWVQGLLAVVDLNLPVGNDSEARAKRRVQRALQELLLLKNQKMDAEEWIRFVRRRLAALRSGGGRAVAGSVHISSLEQVGLSGRTRIFLMGLEDGLLPQPTGDAILDDSARERLHPGLALSRDRVEEALHGLIQRLSGLQGQITLSCSLRDSSSGGELSPSWLFLNAIRLVHRQAVTLHQLEDALGEPVTLGVPQEGPRERLAWWLGQMGADTQAVIQAAYPDVRQGLKAQELRAGADFTEYDGLVSSAAGLYDPRLTERPISVSRLQSLASCPYRYFLEQGLGLRALELSVPTPDQWLDPAARGQMLHEVFALYHRELRSQGRRPDQDKDRGRLAELLTAQLGLIAEFAPAPSQAVEHAETQALHRDVERFLRLEADLSSEGRKPLAFEVGFGMGEDVGEPLARPEPVYLQFLSFGLALRGRIDRIDQVGDEYEVIDYKTGSSTGAGDRKSTFAGGRLLQHALYGLVAEQLLDAAGRSIRSSYYFPTERSKHTWQSYPPADRVRLEEVLDLTLSPTASGAFFHSERGDDCRYCDFKPACKGHDDRHSKAKLENHANALLDYRRRLKEIL